MSKLPKKYQFFDFSDYGRFPGNWIANQLKNTGLTPIHVTTMFVVVGFFAIVLILNHYYISAAFFIIIKSILDAADGELSRLKKTPSYVGRYYDSIADILLNFCFLLSFWYVSDNLISHMLIAFFCIQIQGTIYNYYYVILRNTVNGDSTSRIFEDSAPKALKGESQKMVNIFYNVYDFLYIIVLFVALIAQSCSNEKIENDWTRDNIQGKVLSYSEFSYEAENRFGNIEKGERNRQFSIEYDHQIKYDEKGNEIEYNKKMGAYKANNCIIFNLRFLK